MLLALASLGWSAVAPRVETPVITPGGRTYQQEVIVTVTSATAEAVLHYRTDGRTPGAADAVVANGGQLAISLPQTLKVIGIRAGFSDSRVASATYAFRVASVTASLRGGTYVGERSVTLATTTASAQIYYTLDGSNPTSASMPYTGPIALPGSCTLKAIAMRDGWQTSSRLTVAYTLRLPTPSLDTATGTFSAPFTVQAVGDPATLRYTTTGVNPTLANSLPWPVGGLLIDRTTQVRLAAFRDGWATSSVVRATYTLRAAALVPSLAAGTYTGPQDVALSCASPGVTILYSTNGSTPTTPYTGPIALPGSCTLRAVATRTGWTSSSLRVSYTLRVPAPTFTPAGGEVTAWPLLTVATTPTATYRYTTGATLPTSRSPLFPSAGLQLSAPTTVNVIAIRSGWATSAVASASYSLNLPPVPSIAPLTGDEDLAQTGQPSANDPDTVVVTWSVVQPTSGAVVVLEDAATGRFTYTPRADFHGDDAFVLNVFDGLSNIPLTVTVTVLPVNDAPVATASAVTDEDVAVTVAPDASDADGDTLVWSLVSGPAKGSLGPVDAGTGAVLYTPNANVSGDDQFTLEVTDTVFTVQVVATVTVRAVNDPPVLAGLESALAWYRDGDASVALTSALTVSDVDNAQLAGATISIAGNYQAGDSLILTGALPAGITSTPGAGTLTLSGASSPANYQTALRRVAFTSSQAFPGTAARSVALTVSDGAASSAPVARTLGVVTRSTPPWSDGFEGLAIGGDLHQLELQGLTRWHGWNATPGASALVSAAQARSGGASVAIAGASDLVKEYKGVNAGGWRYSAWQYIPTTFTGTSYFILLNTYRDTAGADGKNWSTQVKFTNSQVLPDFAGGSAVVVKGQWVELRVDIDFAANLHRFYYKGIKLFERSWTGGTTGGGVLNLAAVDLYANGASPVYYDDISLTPIVPTISGGGSVAYLENAAPVAVMPALAVDGFGVAQLSGATVQLTGDLTQDVLSATVSGGIAQSWNPATGTLTLSGNATPAVYQTVLRTVAFANGSDAPSLAPRTVAFTVTAPTGTSNSVSATMTVTPVNDAPVAQALSLSGDEDSVLTGQALASDVDGGALTWTLASLPANGTATVDASGAVSYQPNAEFSGADSFGLAVSDGNGGSATANVAVTVNAVDDAAVIAVPSGGSVTPGSDLVLGAIQVTDIDSPTVTVVVSVDAGTITLTSQPGAVAGNSHTLTGTPAEVTAALAQTVWRAPSLAGPATLTVAGNGGSATVALTTLAAPAPIVVQPLTATSWANQPHGTQVLPAPAVFWRLKATQPGRYHLWVHGSGTAPLGVNLDGNPAGQLAVTGSTGWACQDPAQQVVTLDLPSDEVVLTLVGAGTLDQIILVAETPSPTVADAPILVGPGSVAVFDAKDYSAVLENSGHAWLPEPGVDGAIRVLPDIQKGGTAPVVSMRRGLSYDLYVVQPATFRIWVRGMGDYEGDSVWIGIDGATPTTYVTGFAGTSPIWRSQQNDFSEVYVTINDVGLHRLDLRWREDGTVVRQVAVSGVYGWDPIWAGDLPVSNRSGVATFAGGSELVLEAESVNLSLPSDRGQAWTAQSGLPGVVGQAIQVLPDNGIGYGDPAWLMGAPQVFWYAEFPTPGDYEVWVRGAGPSYSSDSYHLGLAGINTTSSGMTLSQAGPGMTFEWTGRRTNGTRATIHVPSAGVYPVNLWMREDGAAVDRILIRPLDAQASPPSGEGPPASILLPPINGNS